MKKMILLTALALLVPTTAGAAKPVILEKHGYVVAEPRVGNQYYIKQTGTDLTWNTTRGSGDIVVALIDSSADRSHRELLNVPRVVNSMKGPYSVDYHGTHTAGIMSGLHNKYGIAGLAPNVRYHFYNVFYGRNSEFTDSWTVAKAVDTAVAKGATIINLSLGGQDYDRVLADSIKRARAKGVVIVASSGNDGATKVSFPANMKEVIAVGAVDSRHRLAAFSNMDSQVKVVAPGVNVLSLGLKNSFIFMDGTSMAAPMVTSGIALVKSVNPFLTPTDIDGLIQKMPRVSGKSYTELNTKRLLDATPRPVSVSAPATLTNRYVQEAKLSVMNRPNLKTTYTLYQGTRKVKTLPANGGAFTMYAGGDWLPSGQYRLTAVVTDGKYKRTSSRNVTYVNPVKTNVTVKATDEATFSVTTTRKGTVTILDASGKTVYEALHVPGTFPVRGDTTNKLTVILKPTDLTERIVSTTFTPPPPPPEEATETIEAT
ncbi:S8 family peptidase [Exiguobacterium alkaliphilum]|uniref:S8 family serine peptidase n=1 Tax=Exiguobacterium alkaliphilum TaxID=1428684 RepID=A0ABT2KXH8_9BACL|nr:S8 family serine peptidase [Exiguobacterium alkaliphilum]MCT4795637.1 S8 family serine peptidase [Exiguobacterium alkaliphilum]